MSKWGKIRRNPQRFFADSKSGFINRLGELLEPLLAVELVQDLLQEPVETVAAADLPVLSRLGERWLESARTARNQRLARAGYPVVTVVMAAYNAESTIGAAITSIYDQTYPAWKLVIVDDASMDETAVVAADVCNRLGGDRFTLQTLEHNGGAASARNRALASADTDLVLFHDADDFSYPERLAHQVDALVRNANAVVSSCSYQRITRGGEPIRVNGQRFAKSPIGILFRRAVVVERVGYQLEISVSEDTEYFQRICAVFGQGSESPVQRVLYDAEFSPQSMLFGDGETSVSLAEGIRHRRSREAELDWQRILQRLERIERGVLDPYIARGTREVIL